MTNQLVRIARVQDATGLARSTIYALVAGRKFPAPIKVSGRASAWVSEEVAEWVQLRIADSRRSDGAYRG